MMLFLGLFSGWALAADDCAPVLAALNANSEEEVTVEGMPCKLSLDFDGDAKPETLTLVIVDGKPGIRLAWGKGGDPTLWGAGIDPEIAPGDAEAKGMGSDPIDDKLSGIIHWRVKGDGVLFSGTDAAVMVSYKDGKFVWVHLGF